MTTVPAPLQPARFVPLETVQGRHPTEIVALLRGRRLVLWGCGHLGRALARVFRRVRGPSLDIAFCDGRAEMVGRDVEGTLVQPVDTSLGEARSGRSVLLLAVAGELGAVVRAAEQAGLRAEHDFFTYRRVSRPEAKIQVVEDGARMSLRNYSEVLDKLLAEVPHLLQVELTGNPDPLVHPDLPRMIEMARGMTTCVVTSGLGHGDVDAVQAAITSRPGLFVMKLQGPVGGALFSPLLEKMTAAASLRSNVEAVTELRVSYSRQRGEPAAAIEEARRLFDRLGVRAVFCESYVEPYDHLLRRCEGHTVAPEAGLQIERLRWDLDVALGYASLDSALPCLCQRIFPVVNVDSSVGVCELYREPRVAADFRTVSYDRLLEERHRTAHCRECQKHGLHRLDVDVLGARHPGFGREAGLSG